MPPVTYPHFRKIEVSNSHFLSPLVIRGKVLRMEWSTCHFIGSHSILPCHPYVKEVPQKWHHFCTSINILPNWELVSCFFSTLLWNIRHVNISIYVLHSLFVFEGGLNSQPMSDVRASPSDSQQVQWHRVLKSVAQRRATGRVFTLCELEQYLFRKC